MIGTEFAPIDFELASAVGGVSTIPTMFLFAPGGEVKQKFVGTVPEEMFEVEIKKLLVK